ncbi:hypothetical protein OSB04_005316 [Centaurea solstitialis]|uniref:RING-type domain-containing protein n=1 Tax=Centaurea solstitialis TaxID=347529 RepID=A0AA38TRC7_9ASTR|nr:hypothetical protein OSB04_005316 [Centaurea solstitialis]
MPGRPLTFQAVARSANDTIVPAHLLQTLQPINSKFFFIKLTVLFRQGGPTTRHILEIAAPCQHVSDLNMLVWSDIIRFLNQVGSPREALSEVVFRVTICAGEMMADESNADRRVLPLEVLLLFTRPPAELEPPTMVTVDVEETAENCSVCVEELEVGSKAGRLPCNHLFHVECINQWAAYHRTCPNCHVITTLGKCYVDKTIDWMLTDEEVPAALVARMPPDYTIHYFYIRLVVVVQQPFSSHQDNNGPVLILGHQFDQLLAPHFQPIGVSGLSWNEIISFLIHNGIPFHVVYDVATRIISCISRILEDPNHAGRILLPMLVFVSCTASTLAHRFLPNIVMETEAICSICLEDLEARSMASRLPCTHSYHTGCIRDWSSNDPYCPLCGFQLI